MLGEKNLTLGVDHSMRLQPAPPFHHTEPRRSRQLASLVDPFRMIGSDGQSASQHEFFFHSLLSSFNLQKNIDKMPGLCDRFNWAVREHQRRHRLQPIPAKKGTPFDFNKLGCEI
jgi:hypothetical protein